VAASGDLVGEPTPITHPVKFYEKGELPLEIVTSRQWYIGNGGRDAALRQRMLARGEELRWVPEHMRHRYEHWVGGLTGDWLISRQRFFGVPIPVWYPLDEHGEPDTTGRSPRRSHGCRSTRPPKPPTGTRRASAGRPVDSWPIRM